MGEKIRRFVPRAPRYTLRPDDRSSMRFSLADSSGAGAIDQTLLYNLSETGAAFLTTRPERFQLGEPIKVEIPIPHGDQFACWARVVRVEEFSSRGGWFKSKHSLFDEKVVLVALVFEELPPGHARAIRKGLEQCFIQAMRDQQYRNWIYYRTLVSTYFFPALAYLTIAFLAAWFMYYISLPDDNYDAQKGAPWGQRFKF